MHNEKDNENTNEGAFQINWSSPEVLEKTIGKEGDLSEVDKRILRGVLVPITPLLAKLGQCHDANPQEVDILLKRLETIIFSAEDIANHKETIDDEDIRELREDIEEVVAGFVEKNYPTKLKFYDGLNEG